MFTKRNTIGFNQETLDKMNEELEEALQKLGEPDLHYDDNVKNLQDRIFNKYSVITEQRNRGNG